MGQSFGSLTGCSSLNLESLAVENTRCRDKCRSYADIFRVIR